MVTPAPDVLAIVPARGGSKSIPRKNLRAFAGHPLLAYSIAAARAALRVTRVIVSTDDPEIADVARTYGADVPFLRPAELALDATPDLPLFQHALEWLLKKEGYTPEVVVQLRPTSPLRPSGLVDEAVALLFTDAGADCVRSVTAPNQNPYKMWRPLDDGGLHPLLSLDGVSEPFNAARQSLPTVLWQTGHVDVIRRDTILAKQSMTGQRILPIAVPRECSIDIDTETDWACAEFMLRNGQVTVVTPGPPASQGVEPLPPRVSMLVLDFDGVLTDDRVWTDQDGRESVACSRADGFGLETLRASGIPVAVLSRESNPVVAARCRKLRIDYQQPATDKATALRQMAVSRRCALEEIVYVGNDLPDLPCFEIVGCGVAVADAHPQVRARADLVLGRAGGKGAVRELCDLILAHNKRETS